MAYVYANMMQPQNTQSGIAEFLLLAPVSDFTADGIKCPKAPFAEPGDEVKILENHVFKDGKAFAKFVLAPEKNKLDATTIGDKGFNKLNLELTAFIPGSYAEVHEAIKNILNTPLIALIKDSNCPANMYYQLGCDCTYAWATASFGTGTTVDGVKGYEVKISYQNGYIQLYAGTVEVYE